MERAYLQVVGRPKEVFDRINKMDRIENAANAVRC
jgi:hypothetical protein